MSYLWKALVINADHKRVRLCSCLCVEVCVVLVHLGFCLFFPPPNAVRGHLPEF